MAGLLTAQRESVLSHRLQHVAIAHPSLLDLDAVLAHRDDQPEVAHDGGDQGVVVQLALLLEIQCQDRHDVVAVHDGTGRVHGQAAVGVAVQCDTQVGAVLDNRRLQSLDVGRAGVVVDIEAVGSVVDPDDGGAAGLEGGPGGIGCGAVRGVDDHLQAIQPHAFQAGDQRVDVGLAQRMSLVGGDASYVTGDRALPLLVEAFLDGVLDRVVQLDAATLEELDAVVGHRIVGGREHHSQVGALRVDQVGQAGGRHDTDIDDVHTGTG